MRKAVIAGNWKMNTNLNEAMNLVKQLIPVAEEALCVEVIVGPPFVHIPALAQVRKGSRLALSAQNMFWEDKGAFTGEVSALMLQEYECEYVIIGHSERRLYLQESDGMINKKLKAALRHSLLPIVCVGETLQHRQENKTWQVIKSQLDGAFKELTEAEINKFIIAYEPVWAIGTGIAAKPEDAIMVHNQIREYLEHSYSKGLANAMRILYGGSVTSENIRSFISNDTIDGGLVGGASLKFNEFSAIIRTTNEIKGEK